MKPIVHAQNWNGDDRTLCGDAEEEMEGYIADPGIRINCEFCLRVIRYAKKFQRNIQPKNTP